MAEMMKNNNLNGFILRLAIFFALILLPFLSPNCRAHLIQIDHHEFRSDGYPIPPPLPPIDQLPQHLYAAKELTPAELMVDLTNDLTYRILHYHSILNRNNFAFSPCSLMSVLVALYEGAAGRSAMEIKNVLLLPNNRDVIRVGYRDIHRRLRTYFFGPDNPLKGLSLNKENVTITRQYETVLKFYGYDLGIDMVSSTVVPSTTPMPTVVDSTTVMTTVGTTTLPISQTTATTTEMQLPTATTTTTMTTVVVPTTETPIATTSTIATTTTASEAATTTQVVTDMTTTSNTDAAAETSANAETTVAPETTTTVPEMIPTTTNETPAPSEMSENTDTTTTTVTGENQGEAAELISSSSSSFAAEPLLRIQKARVSRLNSGKLQAPLVPPPVVPRTKYLPSARRGSAANRRESRHKRHLVGAKEADNNLFVALFHQQSTHHNLFPISGPATVVTLEHNEYEVDVDPNFLRNPAENKQNYNTDVISHVFYLGHQHNQIIHTTFKVYNAVLYYKYFDHLKMSVLELELDTPEYNLMILLPDYQTDLVSAAASLKLGPTLRILRKQLKPRWVQAIIPDFELHGTMFLTNDLQNMGICDAFEPNRADLHPMTNENRIYVKHIEQSINVNIRTRPINQLKRNYGTQTQPIQISVSHPFLFFIVDRELDVAVMAGRILNPLNVRIQ